MKIYICILYCSDQAQAQVSPLMFEAHVLWPNQSKLLPEPTSFSLLLHGKSVAAPNTHKRASSNPHIVFVVRTLAGVMPSSVLTFIVPHSESVPQKSIQNKTLIQKPRQAHAANTV